MAPPHFRSEQSLHQWYCKTCVGPRGTPWFNYADARECAKCKLGKGLCLLQGRKPGRSPSAWADSVLVQKLKQELAAASAKLKRAEAPPVEAEEELNGSDKDKQRLRELGELPKTVEGSADPHLARAKEAYVKEQAELKAKLAAARPLGQRLRDLGAQISRQQKLQEDQQRRLVGIREKLALLQEQEQAALQQLATLDTQMQELQEQQRQLQSQAPLPPQPEHGKGHLGEPIVGLGQTLAGLDQVPNSLGAEHGLSERLKEDLERLKQLSEEAKAKQQRERDEAAAAAAEAQRAPGGGPPAEGDAMEQDAADSAEFVEEIASAGGDKRRIEEIMAKHGCKRHKAVAAC
ncbi:unnamed protein product [Prorocentrum cordatum]|uniref:RanBP2-type domain-containing protein n=1 Tax=Prorocentrum cordatum TaxID=2364126 RepID=A0ABN9TU21_9DINO|nr:unnamed protein product [Polarella glacialis]